VTGKQVLVAPDGALSSLPLSILPGATPGSYLVEEYAFGYLVVSGLDLVLAKRPRSAGHGLLALGGIDYESADVDLPQAHGRDDPESMVPPTPIRRRPQ
jgi:hypothetical protein